MVLPLGLPASPATSASPVVAALRLALRRSGAGTRPAATSPTAAGWPGSLALPGPAGRGLDAGRLRRTWSRTSGDPVRQEVGADFRAPADRERSRSPASARYSIYDERFSEAELIGRWTPRPPARAAADWRFVAPDLLLARNSILSVFSASSAQRVRRRRRPTSSPAGSTVGGDYHLQLEPGEDSASRTTSATTPPRGSTGSAAHTEAGAELLYLDALENGYVAGRLYGSRPTASSSRPPTCWRTSSARR